MDGEKCLYCGTYVPEGRQVCPQCEYNLTYKMNLKQEKVRTGEKSK